MNTDGITHLGTLGKGIPRICRDVVAQIVSNHLAIESALIKRIEARSLDPEQANSLHAPQRSRLTLARWVLSGRSTPVASSTRYETVRAR